MQQATARTGTTNFLFIPFVLFFFTFFSLSSFSQTNDTTSAPSLTSALSCTIPTTGNGAYSLVNFTATTGIPAGCISGGDGNHYDGWFKFTAANTSETVTIGNFGNNITNSEVQILSRTTPLTSLACGAATATATGLTVGLTYFIRVSNVGAGPGTNTVKASFDICLTHPPPPPSNDDCGGATTLTSTTDCSTSVAGTIELSTATTGLPAGCENVGTHYDVWYKFIATNTIHSVTISGQGSNFTNPEIQLYSGTCGTLASITCGTTTLTYSALSIGATYYLRVSNIGSSPTINGDFNICVTHPTPATIK
jgi:hypothetical protein